MPVKTKLPHEDVYVRLRPSKLHGVGVFAIRDIPAGVDLFPNENTEFFKIKKSAIVDLNEQERKLYEDFCVFEGEDIWIPASFNSLTVSWFLNESKEPNTEYTEDDSFRTTRNVKEGEELTVDYATYSEPPKL